MVKSQNFAIFGLMEQKRFLELLRDPQIINRQDAGELLELKSNFPYFQLAHILTTLAAHQNNSMYFEEFLKKSALLTTNRKKLKLLIDSIKKTTDANPIKEETSIATEENIAILKDELTEPETIMVHEELNITEEIPFQEAIKLDTESGETNTLSDIPQEKVAIAEIIGQDMIVNTTETIAKHDNKRVIPSNQVKNTLLHTNPVDNYRHQESPFQNTEVDTFNDLISKFLENTFEISKPKPQDAIDSFLSNPPKSIKNTFIPEENEVREDLSEKFTSNSNDFFSESLAKIYTKQKKYVKAIETYKKLILSNPQKSAYFASKILEIENLL